MVRDSLEKMVQQPHVIHEQYPLLKLETGNGDIKAKGSATNNSVHVTCTKQFCSQKWPEILSICWISFISLGVLFLIIFALGSSTALTKNSHILLNSSNNSASSCSKNVYIHQIIRHGNYIPFNNYSHLLSHWATEFPSLNFKIVLLYDDLWQGLLSSNPASGFLYQFKFKQVDEDKDSMHKFQTQYKNVKLIKMSLHKFMGITPLRYVWNHISDEKLLFFVRVFSVWQNGGISLDLKTFNCQFINMKSMYRKITEIFYQHNKGINLDNYVTSLDNLEKQDLKWTASSSVNLPSLIVEVAKEVFGGGIPLILSDSYNKPVLVEIASSNLNRQRNKRDIEIILNGDTAISHKPVTYATTENKSGIMTSTDAKNAISQELSLNATTENQIDNQKLDNDTVADVNIANPHETLLNATTENANIDKKPLITTAVDADKALVRENSLDATTNESPSLTKQNNKTLSTKKKFIFSNIFSNVIVNDIMTKASTERNEIGGPEVMILDFSFGLIKHKSTKHLKRVHILSLSSDGSFISSTSRYHKLLAQIISRGFRDDGMSVKNIVTKAVEWCKIYVEDTSYCNHVYLL